MLVWCSTIKQMGLQYFRQCPKQHSLHNLLLVSTNRTICLAIIIFFVVWKIIILFSLVLSSTNANIILYEAFRSNHGYSYAIAEADKTKQWFTFVLFCWNSECIEFSYRIKLQKILLVSFCVLAFNICVLNKKIVDKPGFPRGNAPIHNISHSSRAPLTELAQSDPNVFFA